MFSSLWVEAALPSMYTLTQPTPVARPQLLAWSDGIADELPRDPELWSGNRLPPECKPYSACYGGHQFGHWAGQLGDGRAITLGEFQGQEFQLKGAGQTAYSRRGDGRAVLRSSLREYVCSEAMFYLGVPSTRALALVLTGDSVIRDRFYDGNIEAEPGAIVTRVAPHFQRFGHFEIFAARGQSEELRHLCPGEPLTFFAEVVAKTASLVAHWMAVGFVHGVMNTDNLSTLGITIDYGPYGWLDAYLPHFTPNTSDRAGRYAYAQQPHIAHWNLCRLAEALLPLDPRPEAFQEIIDQFPILYRECQRTWQSRKLGGASYELHDRLLLLMAREKVDYTLLHRHLIHTQDLQELSSRCFYQPPQQVEEWKTWLVDFRQSLPDWDLMKRSNPTLIPRNYLVQQLIDAATEGDFAPLQRWMQWQKKPYEELPDSPWNRLRPDDAAHCDALSCSS